MSDAQKVFALLHALTRKQIEDMPASIRKRFVERCREVAEMAEAKPMPPKSGILADLDMGLRPQ